MIKNSFLTRLFAITIAGIGSAILAATTKLNSSILQLVIIYLCMMAGMLGMSIFLDLILKDRRNEKDAKKNKKMDS